MERWHYIRDDLQYSIYIWVMDIVKSNTLKILYGFACPTESQVPNNRWFAATVEKNKDIKANIMRLSSFINGKELKIFLDMLLEGDNLADISSKVGIEKLPESFKSLSLNKEDYRMRPPVFLETRESVGYNRKELRPTASLADSPMICEAIINIAKEKLFNIDADIDDYEIMKFIKNTLGEELPLDIPGPDAERLGNFESFSFAYENSKDTSPVKAQVVREDDSKVVAVNVSIKPNNFKDSIFLRCRTRNGNVIIGDQIRLVPNAHISQDFIFRIYENCSEIEVSVWDANMDQSLPIALLYEHRVPLMRTMHTTMQIGGMQGRIEAQWTKKISKKSGGESIHNEFSRVTRSYTRVGGFENDPWVPAGRSIINIFENNFPDKSSAIFFSKGWQDENRFVKWLQEIVGTYKAHKVILIDPYFDAEAVSKFLALSNYSDVVYEVIADVGRNKEIAKEITEECSKMKAVLPQGVKIHGLIRTNGGTDQIFHDRFIILFGENETPNVYMLSNSISNVSKSFPSVIVPVPDDVGYEIMEYYMELIDGNGKHEVPKVYAKILWPIEIDEKNVSDSKVVCEIPEEFPGYTRLRNLFFKDGSIPMEQMEGGDKLQIAQDEKDKIRQFETLGKELNKLLTNDENKAIELWCGIANWSVRMQDCERDEMYEWFNTSAYRETFIGVANQCIRKAVDNDYPIGVKNAECKAGSIGIARQSLLSFNQLYRLADTLIENHFENDYPSIYSISEAFEYLLTYDPGKAFEALSHSVNYIRKMDEKLPTSDMGPYYKVISTCLYKVAYKLSLEIMNSDFSFISLGLNSEVAIVRAMCAVAISNYLNRRETSNKEIDRIKIIDLLNNLKDSVEKIYSLSWIGYDCQVLRNQMSDNNVSVDMMENIKKKVTQDWPVDAKDDKFLRSLLKNFSGPHEGGHSADIFEVLEKLVNGGKITVPVAEEYIRTVLSEKISDHLEGEKRYYGDIDLPFTCNAVLFYSKVLPESTDRFVDEINRVVNKTKGQLIKPFARSKSYSDWNNSIEALCWCGIIISQLYLNTRGNDEKLENIYCDIYYLILPLKDDFNDNSLLLYAFLKEGCNSGLINDDAIVDPEQDRKA